MIPNIKIESNSESHQVTVPSLLQMTVNADGSAKVVLAGKHIEVNRDMTNNTLTIAHPTLRTPNA